MIDITKDCATVTEYVERWAAECPDRVWLRDRAGDEFTEWTWAQALDEYNRVAAWLEELIGDRGARCAILSKNRAHWTLADMAIAASGNISIPIFTTLRPKDVSYILDFAGVDYLFLGESDNWEAVQGILPEHVKVITLPGVEWDKAIRRWEDVTEAFEGRRPTHVCQRDELLTIPFTSGTTGTPKGVMQTHDSMLIPMIRARNVFAMRVHPRFLSYLPLSHIAERQLIWIQSLVYCGDVTFNEGLPHLLRDMASTRPTYFFGAPRVWEQLQQGILAQFGSQDKLDQALAANGEAVGAKIRGLLGLDDTDYLLTAAAPTPAALIYWWEKLGITLMEGYGQTEAMALIASTEENRRVGSIGKPAGGVEVRIGENDELLCRAEGLALGYYKRPDETAETFVNGWVHTGDKARVDEHGFYYITGRVKDYFKTIHAKFVAPVPIEAEFARSHWVEQQCLLGRGFSKTVMVCVLSAGGQTANQAEVETDLRELVAEINEKVEKHARIGVVMVSHDPWTIENGVLTPTLKIKRETVHDKFGGQAEALAHEAAEQHKILFAWLD
ncbi:MAG: AMP-binding protein [Xanthomonadales bacterium]|nr:AMP-binding protein [Xanthomonadales bacterium]